jgi:hypothetical protein
MTTRACPIQPTHRFGLEFPVERADGLDESILRRPGERSSLFQKICDQQNHATTGQPE